MGKVMTAWVAWASMLVCEDAPRPQVPLMAMLGSTALMGLQKMSNHVQHQVCLLAYPANTASQQVHARISQQGMSSGQG